MACCFANVVEALQTKNEINKNTCGAVGGLTAIHHKAVLTAELFIIEAYMCKSTHSGTGNLQTVTSRFHVHCACIVQQMHVHGWISACTRNSYMSKCISNLKASVSADQRSRKVTHVLQVRQSSLWGVLPSCSG